MNIESKGDHAHLYRQLRAALRDALAVANEHRRRNRAVSIYSFEAVSQTIATVTKSLGVNCPLKVVQRFAIDATSELDEDRRDVLQTLSRFEGCTPGPQWRALLEANGFSADEIKKFGRRKIVGEGLHLEWPVPAPNRGNGIEVLWGPNRGRIDPEDVHVAIQSKLWAWLNWIDANELCEDGSKQDAKSIVGLTPDFEHIRCNGVDYRLSATERKAFEVIEEHGGPIHKSLVCFRLNPAKPNKDFRTIFRPGGRSKGVFGNVIVDVEDPSGDGRRGFVDLVHRPVKVIDPNVDED